jgi:hypothetical protein
MGDQRILNPDIRVGTSFDAMVGANADLMVTLMTTFRYSRWAGGFQVGDGVGAGVGRPRGRGRRVVGARVGARVSPLVPAEASHPPPPTPRYLLLPTREAIHLILHQEAQPKDIVTAYLQVGPKPKRTSRGLARGGVRAGIGALLQRRRAAPAREVLHGGTGRARAPPADPPDPTHHSRAPPWPRRASCASA